MKGWRRALGVGLAIATIALLAWLRDPAWLADVETGFRPWTVDGEGTRGRWIGGHASFFVPADAVTVTIPLRAAGSPGDPATTVSITIDDRPADRIVLNDGRWRESRLRMPPPGSRHLRRIDIRADRVQEGNRGVMVGEVHVSGLGSQGFSRLSGVLRVRGS